MTLLALSIIVKDCEKTLERALLPFKGVVDEIVAVDTGSTDRTLEILNSFDARVIEQKWEDDFSKARNVALEQIKTEWFFSIDSDEWVSGEEAVRIKEMCESNQADAVMFETINFVADGTAGALSTTGADTKISDSYVLSTKVRLAKTSLQEGEGLRWRGVVHELLDDDAREKGYRIGMSPIQIRHDGMMGSTQSEYYVGLCNRSYEEGTATPSILLLLAVEAVRQENMERAEMLALKALKMERRFARAYAWLGQFYFVQGETRKGLSIVQRGVKLCQFSSDFAELAGVAIKMHREVGDENGARVILAAAYNICPNDLRLMAK